MIYREFEVYSVGILVSLRSYLVSFGRVYLLDRIAMAVTAGIDTPVADLGDEGREGGIITHQFSRCRESSSKNVYKTIITGT